MNQASLDPLCFLDIESAVPGVRPDAARDRVVHLHMRCTSVAYAGMDEWFFRCNPGFKMSAENTAIHGITNEMAAGYKLFAEQAHSILELISGHNIVGYNSNNYDVPLLWEEFARVGIAWDLSKVKLIDVGNIFKKKEERTLSAAVKFYLGREHEGAHGAAADTQATMEVFYKQLQRYPELDKMSLDELAEFSAFEKRADLAGKLGYDAAGAMIYNIGAARGTRVQDNPSFGRWMLTKDFAENTKQVLRKALAM